MRALFILLGALVVAGVAYAQGPIIISGGGTAAPASGGTDYTLDANCQFAGLYDGASCAALVATQCGAVATPTCRNAPTVVADCSGSGSGPAGSPSGDECLDFEADDSEDVLGDDSGGDYDELDINGDFTMFCWGEMETSTANMMVMNKKVTVGWSYLVRSANDLKVFIDSTSEISSGGFTDSVWGHMGYRYNATSNELQPIVNGLEDCTPSCTTDTGGATANADPFVIASNGAANYFDGKLYECAVFDRLFDNTEVAEVFLCGLRGNANGTARDSAYGGATCAAIATCC